MNSLKHAEELCRFPLLFPRSHVVLSESFVMNLNERGAGRSCPHSPSLRHHGAAEMVFQLRVHPPTGGDGQIIDLCDNEEQMKKMTVLQLKQIINKTFTITGRCTGSSVTSWRRFFLWVPEQFICHSLVLTVFSGSPHSWFIEI